MKRENVIIFGAGNIGEQFVYEYFDKINICYFWDNNKTGELLGYPIQRPEFNKQYFIIVTSKAYLEIREQLIQMGYNEFNDFIPFQIFEKKMAIVYGNCHIGIIGCYLERHREFFSEYGLYPFPLIHAMKNMKFEYYSILQNCDLFLHQSIRRENVYGAEYSSEEMLKYVNKACKVISIPNLYGLPKYLFPQLNMQYNGPVGRAGSFFVDDNIVKWLEVGKKKEEIISYISSGGVYSRRKIIDMWESFKWRLVEREKEWDIKISDYILNNQQKDKIFCDTNHITSKTAREIASRILAVMGYQRAISVELPAMDTLEVFVYQDVKEALGLVFEEKFIRKYTWGGVFEHEMDLEEYVERLCQYTRFLKDYKTRVMGIRESFDT